MSGTPDRTVEQVLHVGHRPVSETNPLPTTSVGGGSGQTDGLTDTELRATPVAVTDSGQQTDALTDTELRATPVPVSGTVTATGTQTDALTDTELRFTPVPVTDAATLLLLREATWLDPSTATVGTKSTAAQETIVTPAAGQSLRVRRVWLQADAALDTGTVVVTVRVGSTVLDIVQLTGSQPYVNPEIRVGTADEVLSLQCSSTASVRYNFSTQEFTP